MLFILAPAVRAQSTCGWSAPAAAGHLPADVEAITSQISPGWADPDKIIAGLTRWYHECDGGAARQAIYDLKRAVDRGAAQC